jgi:hypothetical protein
MSLPLRLILDVKNADKSGICSRERYEKRWLQTANFHPARLSQRYCLHSEA